MKVPKSIRVGGVVWKIRSHRPRDNRDCGQVDWNKGVIDLWAHKAVKEQTLVHELMHVALWAAGHNELNSEDNDDFVDALAGVWTDILRQLEESQ